MQASGKMQAGGLSGLKSLLGMAKTKKDKKKTAPKAKKVAKKAAAKKVAKKAASPKGASKVAKAEKKVAKSTTSEKAVKKAAPKKAAPAKKSKKTKELSAAEKVEQIRAASKAATELGASEGLSAQARAAASTLCREVACENDSNSAGYCRLHYIKNWKKVKRKELILKEKKLNRYIEELVAKYPDKYLEAIREDLANDKAFNKVVSDLSLDETAEDEFDGDNESIDSLIGNLRRDREDEDSY